MQLQLRGWMGGVGCCLVLLAMGGQGPDAGPAPACLYLQRPSPAGFAVAAAAWGSRLVPTVRCLRFPATTNLVHRSMESLTQLSSLLHTELRALANLRNRAAASNDQARLLS